MSKKIEFAYVERLALPVAQILESAVTAVDFTHRAAQLGWRKADWKMGVGEIPLSSSLTKENEKATLTCRFEGGTVVKLRLVNLNAIETWRGDWEDWILVGAMVRYRPQSAEAKMEEKVEVHLSLADLHFLHQQVPWRHLPICEENGKGGWREYEPYSEVHYEILDRIQEFEIRQGLAEAAAEAARQGRLQKGKSEAVLPPLTPETLEAVRQHHLQANPKTERQKINWLGEPIN